MKALGRARAIADAVLYEGYLLYPYAGSAPKNRIRWQFGVAAPRVWSAAGGCEDWAIQTETLVDGPEGVWLAGKLRFLQVVRRGVELRGEDGSFVPAESAEIDGQLFTSWDEAIEREVDFSAPVTELDWGERDYAFVFPREASTEEVLDADGAVAARLVRESVEVRGRVRVRSARQQADRPLWRLAIRVENTTPWLDTAAPREDVMAGFIASAHTLLELDGGRFLSLADPPAWASEAAEACNNHRTWPVLVGDVGDDRAVLCSPIILEDHPSVAPESPGDLYDATEIDEILTLRTMTLTDDEKRSARATDPRAAAVIDAADSMPREVFERLHGTLRDVRETARDVRDVDPGAKASMAVDGVTLRQGSRVVLRPSRATRATDAQDMFLEGRVGVVHSLRHDVDGGRYLAVTIEGDPAAEVQRIHGRYRYFAPEEVDPIP